MTITAAAMPPINGPFELSSSASEPSSVPFPMPVTTGSWLRDVKVELESDVEVDRSEAVADVFKSVRNSGLQGGQGREYSPSESSEVGLLLLPSVSSSSADEPVADRVADELEEPVAFVGSPVASSEGSSVAVSVAVRDLVVVGAPIMVVSMGRTGFPIGPKILSGGSKTMRLAST